MKKLIKHKALYASIFMLAFAATGCSLAPKEEVLPDAPVIQNVEVAGYTKVAVLQGDLRESISVDCTYTAFQTDRLNFQVNGERLSHVYVEVGDEVKAGDVLADLNLEDFLSKVEECNTNIKAIEMKMNQAKELKQWAENTQLELSSFSTYTEQIHESYKQEIKNYEETIQKLEDDLSLEQLRLSTLKDDVAKRQLIAKFDGVVSYIKVFQEWETTNREEHFMTVYNPNTMVFVTNGKNSDLFEDGMEVEVVSGENKYLCEVISTEEFLQKVEGLKVGNERYLRLIDEDAQLQNGDRGKITFVLNEYLNVLYLPSSAVISDSGKSMVYVEDETGFKTLKEIKIGATVNGNVIIESGLNAGDSVIVK